MASFRQNDSSAPQMMPPHSQPHGHPPTGETNSPPHGMDCPCCSYHDQRLNQLQATVESLRKDIKNGSPTAPTLPDRPQPFTIRVQLGRRDIERVQASNPYEMLRALVDRGSPLNRLKSVQEFNRVLYIRGDDYEFESDLRNRAGEILSALGLVDSRVAPENYYVKVLSSNFTPDDLKQPSEWTRVWSDQNGVTITTAFWTSGKLILAVHCLDEALHLCRSSVWLSGRHAYAEPYDIRAKMKLCWSCGKPGHMKNECPTPHELHCLKCGMKNDHGVWDCREKRRECLNCGQSHSAYSPQCTHPEVLRTMGDCEYYHEIGPPWKSLLYHGNPRLQQNGATRPTTKAPSRPPGRPKKVTSSTAASTRGPMDAHVVTSQFTGRTHDIPSRFQPPPQGQQASGSHPAQPFNFGGTNNRTQGLEWRRPAPDVRMGNA